MVNIDLNKIVNLANQTSETAKGYLKSNALGHLWMWIQKELGIMPAWAENHIKATKEFEKAVAQYQKEGKAIPPDAVKKLNDCREVVQALSYKVAQSQFIELVKIDRPTLKGSSGLLTGVPSDAPLPSTAVEWQVNLGLMLNAYRRAETPELKKEISFLTLNYLAKAAPISFFRLENLLEDQEAVIELKSLFQFGFFTEHAYHRENDIFNQGLNHAISDALAKSTKSEISYPLDTENIDQLFQLTHQTIDFSVEKASDTMSQVILDHFEHSSEPFDIYLSKRFLFDLTPLFSESIVTNKNEEKETKFENQLNQTKEKMDQILQSTLDKIKLAHPDLLKSGEDEKKMILFLKKNMVTVCRTRIKNIGLLKGVPIYSESRGGLSPLVNLTGIRLGAVAARFHIFDFLNLEKLISDSGFKFAEYSVPGSQETVYFHNPDEITKTQLFTRFKAKMENFSKEKEHQAILGNATLQLVEGLFKEMGPDTWKLINRDPTDLEGTAQKEHMIRRTLFQTTLYRLTQHLAKAENNLDDFNKFADAIELVHYEMAALLELTHPFKEGEFQEIYTEQLKFIPQELKGFVTAGVTKSAMNTFSAVLSALKTNNPSAEFAYGKDSYFEEAELLGEKRSVEEVVANPNVPKVDFYVGEFNHNININPGYHHYKPGNVIHDIKELLKKKPSENLTVAIDSTIDLANSPKAAELLTIFSKEIKEGRLNIIFFRSGQKFEMLGMDNYYGAPYYMINNGASHWDHFKKQFSQEAFKTDSLSLNWYCFVNKYTAQQLDAYRAKIFQNSREILQKVPPDLQKESSAVRVSTVDPKMDPAFVDIKIVDQNLFGRREIENIFYQKMAAQGRKVHSRGSFGFYHPNFNFIGDDVIRINPGLDPRDNAIILEVLQEVNKILEERILEERKKIIKQS